MTRDTSTPSPHVIRRLEPAAIAFIRAGEVVENPAGIVKELVENAIDAGSTELDIRVDDGGRLISISDNGCGIPEGSLPLAVERHATSKLDVDDLGSIRWLGFRGEALASIGAVSDLTVSSRVAGEDTWSIRVDHGATGGVCPAQGLGTESGTVVTVRDLFRDVPARLSFMSAAHQEYALVCRILSSLALAHPGVAFRVRAGQTRMFFGAVATREERVAQVMGGDFMASSYRFDGVEDGIEVSVWLASPTASGLGNVHHEIVNGRPVSDTILSGAVSASIADIIPTPGRRRQVTPSYVVSLSVPADALDVNAHPQKSKVRFASPGDVRSLIVRTIRDGLAGSAPAERAALSLRAAAHALVVRTQEKTPAARTKSGLGTPLVVVGGVYGVGETDTGISLVDIHAAHERLVYEALKRDIRGGHLGRHTLPSPVVVKAGHVEVEAARFWSEELEQAGFTITARDDVIEVSSVPALLAGSNHQVLVDEVIGNLSEHSWDNPVDGALDRLCSLMACHNAIRDGQTISVSSLGRLFDEMEKTGLSSFCNHGRPTAFMMKREDLDNLFCR